VIDIIVPVKLRRRTGGVREPVERDVIEHLISREFALGLAARISPSGELIIHPGSRAGREPVNHGLWTMKAGTPQRYRHRRVAMVFY
jgi:hypothetical protein